MKKENLTYKKVEGKTYNLFGEFETSNEYYELIKNFTDYALSLYPGEEELLHLIRIKSRHKHRLKHFINYDNHSIIGTLIKSAEQSFSQFTGNVSEHLATIGLHKPFDKTIRTSLEQYYLYMLEIELTNRIDKSRFEVAEYKFALLPHCLHDLEKECQSELSEIDYQCKKCSQKCFIHYVSQILNDKDIHPYIWMELKFKDIVRKLRGNYKTIGIFGIACIPELARGMRMCSKAALPAIGIPLNANRCRRWMGQFHENSVNVDEIEKLFTK